MARLSSRKRKYFPLGSAKQEILYSIRKSGPRGIIQKDVLKDTGLHRDTVHELTQVLEDEGNIKVLNVGRTTKYVMKLGGLDDLEGGYLDLMSFYASRNLLSTINMAPTDDNDDTLGRPTSFDSPFFAEKKRTTNLDYSIFEVSNRIGALTIYLMLRGLSLLRQTDVEEDQEGTKSKFFEDRIASAMSRILSDSMSEVMIWMRRHIDIVYNLAELPPGYMHRDRSLYDCGQETIEEFLQAFANSYPAFYDRLKGMEKEIRLDIEKAGKGHKK